MDASRTEWGGVTSAAATVPEWRGSRDVAGQYPDAVDNAPAATIAPRQHGFPLNIHLHVPDAARPASTTGAARGAAVAPH